MINNLFELNRFKVDSAEKLWAEGTPLVWTKITAYLLKHAGKPDFLENSGADKQLDIINKIAKEDYSFLVDESNKNAVWFALIRLFRSFDHPVIPMGDTRESLKKLGMFVFFSFFLPN